MRKSGTYLCLILSILLLLSCSTKQKKEVTSTFDREKPKIVNIINFIRLLEPRSDAITEDVLYQTVVNQIQIMQRYNLGGTFLLQYDALLDLRYQKLLKSLPDSLFEIGGWFEIPQPLVENAGMKWRGRYSWDWHANVGFATGYTPEEREKLVDVYMADFKKIFGHYPKSMGCWFIDAHSLNYMYEKYGIVATCNCKDQVGTDGYNMWGGYWSQAYYPSKKNAYMPAQNAENQIPVPIFRMLGSDPVHQYDSGIDKKHHRVISLEPVYPDSGGDSTWVNWYFKHFVEGESMEFAYVQAGQENSFTWEKMQKGYEIQIPLIAKLRDEKKIKVETLSQSGEWFSKKYKTTPATSVTVLEDLPGYNQKTVWFNSRFYRTNLNLEDGTLRIRDIHLFDENMESLYLKERGTSNQCNFYTLPFMDGFFWSSPEEKAGLYFHAMVNGKDVLLKGDHISIIESINGVLTIDWSLDDGMGTFTINLDEEKMKVSLYSNEIVDWYLTFKTAEKAQLPFIEIEEKNIGMNFENVSYKVITAEGNFIRSGSNNIFNIQPDNNRIVLQYSDSDILDKKL